MELGAEICIIIATSAPCYFVSADFTAVQQDFMAVAHAHTHTHTMFKPKKKKMDIIVVTLKTHSPLKIRCA